MNKPNAQIKHKYKIYSNQTNAHQDVHADNVRLGLIIHMTLTTAGYSCIAYFSSGHY